MLKTDFFSFDLPEKFIAQNPVSPRDHSRLFTYDASQDKIFHHHFFDLRKFLKTGDVLVLNTTKVVPARLIFGDKDSAKEIFLLKDLGGGKFKTLVRPGKFFKSGREIGLSDELSAAVEEILEDGSRIIQFKGADIGKELDRLGEMPLPPYIKHSNAVFDQYQTVFAKQSGSVAAPTAGLHFTEDLINNLNSMGVEFAEVVLHVGRGTFLPVKSNFVSDHKMHEEFFSISAETANLLNNAVTEKRRIIAVGTTSVRVLETNFVDGKFVEQAGETDIFIYPKSYHWKIVSGLITNFHLPKSTLLMLVASFLESRGVKDPIDKILDFYEIAKKEGYRFYSFGDAMFLF